MKLRSLTVCVLGGALVAAAADRRLRIDPAQPHLGQTVTITFDPTGGPLERSQALTLVYGETPNQWSRVEMHPKGKSFTAELRITYSYLWCWVEDEASGEKDTNRGTVWDTYVYDEKGFPLKGARQLRADMYQLRGQPVEKNAVSLDLLEEELRAFPSNGFARGEWWGLRFEDAGRTNAARDLIAHEIAVYLDSSNDKAWAYEAAANAYHRIGLTRQAVDVMRAFVKRFPEDASLDGIVGFYFMAGKDVADLQGLQRVSKRWAANPSYWESLFNAYNVSGFPKPEQLQREGEQWVASMQKGDANAARIRIRVAEAWLAHGVEPAAAERVAREAVSLAETGGIFTKNSSPNPNLTSRTMTTPVYRSTLAWALFQQKRYDEALSELERAVAIIEKDKIQTQTRDVYYRLGQTLERLNLPADALEAYISEFASANDNLAAWDAARAMYSKIHGGAEGFEAFIRSRANELVLSEHAQQPIEELNEKIGLFDLRGADGQPVSLSRYTGRVVIIDFWGTWCGPCLASLENTEKLERQFPGKVVVLAVSVDWEETRGRAQPFLTEKGYDFTLLFDDEHRRNLQFYGVPARFLLDRNGRLRVRQSGAGPYADLAFEQKLQALVGDPQP